MTLKNCGRKKYILFMLCLTVLLILAMLISLTVGSSDLTARESLNILCSRIPLLNMVADTSGIPEQAVTIIFKIRLPRILLAMLTGGALALSGTSVQGIFRNPLSDPYILGVSSGAALFGTIAIIMGLSISLPGQTATGIMSFAGALITVFFVYTVSRIGGRADITNLLLTGTAINTMFSGLISLILIFHHEQLNKVYMWTLGSFSAAGFEKIIYLAVIMLICCPVLIFTGGKLNVLLLGEDEAQSLGIDTKKLMIITVICSSLLTSGAVSVSGIIGFVGLIIPHSLRLLFGSNNRIIMPFSLVGGALFMVICDTLSRSLIANTEIPVGIFTAIFGAPFFIWLVILNRRKYK